MTHSFPKLRSSGLYARLAKTNTEAAANIKEIWRSPMIPSDPMVWRKALPEDAKQQIYYFFMQYGRFGDMEKVKRERDVLAGMSDGWGPFLASSDAQLLDVRQLEAFKAKITAENSGDAAAVAAADAELKKLQGLSVLVGPAGY